MKRAGESPAFLTARDIEEPPGCPGVHFRRGDGNCNMRSTGSCRVRLKGNIRIILTGEIMTDQERITELEEGLKSLFAYVKRLEDATIEHGNCLADDVEMAKAMACVLAEGSYRGTSDEFIMAAEELVLRDSTGTGPATVGPANRIDN